MGTNRRSPINDEHIRWPRNYDDVLNASRVFTRWSNYTVFDTILPHECESSFSTYFCLPNTNPLFEFGCRFITLGTIVKNSCRFLRGALEFISYSIWRRKICLKIVIFGLHRSNFLKIVMWQIWTTDLYLAENNTSEIIVRTRAVDEWSKFVGRWNNPIVTVTYEASSSISV